MGIFSKIFSNARSGGGMGFSQGRNNAISQQQEISRATAPNATMGGTAANVPGGNPQNSNSSVGRWTGMPGGGGRQHGGPDTRVKDEMRYAGGTKGFYEPGGAGYVDRSKPGNSFGNPTKGSAGAKRQEWQKRSLGARVMMAKRNRR